MTELEIVKELGKQVASNKPLTCPNCAQWSGPKDELQPLSSFGDYEETLFCPHCDLTVSLTVILDK